MSSGFADFLRQRAAEQGAEAREVGAEGRSVETGPAPGLPRPAAPRPATFSAFLRERATGNVPAATRGALVLADPAKADAFARDREIGRRAGLPAIAIEGPQRAEFERQDALRQNLDALRDSPATARFLGDEEHARLAADSVGELTYFERYWRSLQGAREQDLRQRRVTGLQRRAWAGLASDAEEEELRLLRAVETPDHGIGDWSIPAWAAKDRHLRGLFVAAGFIEQAPIAATESFGSTKEGIIASAEGAGVGGVLALGAAALIGAPAAALIAPLVAGGAVLGGILSAGSAEGAGAFDAMRERGVSEPVARAVAVPVGLISGAVEVGALGVQLRNVPGVRGLVRRKLMDAVERPLLQRVVTDIATAAATEALEEAVQETTQVGGDWLADVAEGRDPGVTFEAEVDGQPVTLTGWDALVARVAAVAVRGGQAGLVFGGATGAVQAGASLAQRSAAVARARQRGEALGKLSEALDASKIAERAPDVLEAHAREAIAEHQAPEHVYIPSERFLELLQSAAPDLLGELDRAIPGLRDRVAEAGATGADVELRGESLPALLRTELGKGLVDDLRFDPGEMTAREAEAEAPKLEAEVKALLDAGDQEEAGLDAIGQYRQRLERALSESGAYDPATAARMAQLEEAMLRTTSEREGLAPEEALRTLGTLTIETPKRRLRTLPELVLNETKPLPLGEQAAGAPELLPARIDRARTSALIEELRTGRKAEQEKMSRLPLLALLNRLGGVQKDSRLAGELRSMGVTHKTMPGLFRKEGGVGEGDNLVRSENRILGSIAATPGTDYADPRALLDAIRDEIAGRPVRTDEQTQAIVEAELARESMAEEVERLGLDLSRPDEELLQALEAEAIRQQAEGVPRGTEDAASGPFELFQPGRGDAPRGSLSVDPEAAELREVTMRLAASRDLSTFLHESGHLWLERLRRLAARAQASDRIKADLGIVREWWKAHAEDVLRDARVYARKVGLSKAELDAIDAATVEDVARMADSFVVRDGDLADPQLLRALHEYWARGVEAYLMEGKAPSLELRELFSRFLVWLTALYRNASSLRVELSDEVRGVMDRLVATEAQMAELEASQEITPLSEELQAELMTEAERARYADVADRARLKIREKITATALSEVRARQTEAYADAEKRIRAKVDEDLKVNAAVTARHWLVTGEWLTEVPKPDDLAHGKLSREALVAMYGDQVRNMPTGERGWVAPAGAESAWHPDQVAELFGFDTGHDLVTKLRGLPSREKSIELETKARLRAEFGDKGAAVAETAADVLADIPEVAEMALIEELAIAKKAGGQGTPRQVLVQVARRLIDETKGRDLAPHKYRAAASRAAKTAAKALAAKDYRTAQGAKRQQALNLILEREARDAREEVDKAGDYFRRVQEGSTRKIIEKAGHTYAGQMDALLGRFDLRNRSNRALDRKGNLAAWIAEHEARGEVVPIPEQMRNEAFRRNWREMTVGQMRMLRESVEAIEHLARSKVEYVTAREKLLMEEARAKLIEGARANIAGRPPPPGLPDYNDGRKRRALSALSGLGAGLQKIEFLVDWLDGGRPDGPWRRYVFTPIAEAEVRRNDLNAKYTAAIADLMKPLLGGDYTTKKPIPELGANFSRSDLVALALNQGNESNAEKSSAGAGWDQATVLAVLQRELSAADWRFVQGVWDLIDTLWPEIVEQERKLTGVVPERVEARTFEVVTPDGERLTMRGGYYPVVYDPNKARWAYKHASRGVYADVEDHFHRAVTGHGYTFARTEAKGPVLLDLGVIPRHLDQVIHDLTHRATLLQVDKLLDSDAVHAALEETVGREYARLFLPWLQAIAKDRIADNRSLATWQKLLRTARINSTIFTLGFRATTLGVQPLGHSNAIGILRKRLPNYRRHYAAAVSLYARNPLAAARAAAEASGEMRHRQGTIDRDLRDALRREFGDTTFDRTLETLRWPGAQAMRLIGLVQFYAVDVPVWTASFQGAQAELDMDEEAAAIFADSIVRLSQSSGSVKDLSEWQRGNEFQKVWTTYFSYMNVVGNQLMRDLRDVHSVRDFGDFLVSWTLYLSIPSTAAMLLRDALTDDRDDDEKRWTDLERILQALGIWDFFGTIPLVREAVAGLRYGSRGSTPLQRAAQAGSDLLDSIAKEDRSAREILFDGARVAGIAAGLPAEWLLREGEQEIKERE